MYYIRHIASGHWLLSPHDHRNFSDLVPAFNGGLTKPDQKLVLGLREFHLDGYSVQEAVVPALAEALIPIHEALTLLDTAHKGVPLYLPIPFVFLFMFSLLTSTPSSTTTHPNKVSSEQEAPLSGYQGLE